MDAGRHTWGHDQLKQGVETRGALGAYIVFMDDDDVFAPDALAGVRAAVERDERDGASVALLAVPNAAVILPVWPDLRETRVGGHCVVTPNDAGMSAGSGRV